MRLRNKISKLFYGRKDYPIKTADQQPNPVVEVPTKPKQNVIKHKITIEKQKESKRDRESKSLQSISSDTNYKSSNNGNLVKICTFDNYSRKLVCLSGTLIWQNDIADNIGEEIKIVKEAIKDGAKANLKFYINKTYKTNINANHVKRDLEIR